MSFLARVDWRLPVCGTAIAVAISVLLLLTPVFDFAELFFMDLAVPVTLFILLLIAARQKSVSVLATAIVVAATAYFVHVNSDPIRFSGRWILWGRQYKAALFRQSSSAPGLLHVEWDGWGFAGNDTVVYAVYDPHDSLSVAADKHLSGQVPGVPCGVSSVYRLQKHWYSVVMYTDTDWNDCP